jgi:hypothetical protein
MNDNQSIGMMEGAFFVPKGDLLAWINSTLALDIKQIEQLGTGAAYCQIIDVMYPGKVAMARVNWRARNEWEFINNYKILQQAFAKCKVQKHIDIEKLSKGKYQDNLEFVQWLKRYFDLHNKSDPASYDAPAARKHAPVDFSFVEIRNPLKPYPVPDPVLPRTARTLSTTYERHAAPTTKSAPKSTTAPSPSKSPNTKVRSS